jgi:hypothetical protein
MRSQTLLQMGYLEAADETAGELVVDSRKNLLPWILADEVLVRTRAGKLGEQG